MQIRDRIKELRRVEARTLRPNPRNWRTHPDGQRDVLKGILSEIGFADALLARELGDGSLELIDGHLRAETAPDQQVPVLVLDLSPEEADKLLAVFDPLAAMAETDRAAIENLLKNVDTENAAVRAMLDDLVAVETEATSGIGMGEADTGIEIPELYQVVIECESEEQQREVYDRMRREGLRCRLLSM